ncbi:inhibitor of sigma-G Gin [Paenibacillus yonginensis]|uniref:Inhibitor of sigma-G Gin n=1 Tax=Paenibacillus yonginensis TaxID=1462996 RepID=A0A1B1N4T6_9BACL|nr:sigma factor G inhibitor Gin [Paenibacillus yonginensis]ANS76405.1 inhibitor of sigma-G Gin [Paenibacillus yonginensis]
MEDIVKPVEILKEEGPETCIICGKTKAQGIKIVSEFICEECEAEMVHTDVKDEKYDFFIHQMKQIWVQLNA